MNCNTKGTEMEQTSADSGFWKVTDPARVASGMYGITYHKTKKAAETRCAMFHGSVMEYVPASSGNA